MTTTSCRNWIFSDESRSAKLRFIPSMQDHQGEISCNTTSNYLSMNPAAIADAFDHLYERAMLDRSPRVLAPSSELVEVDLGITFDVVACVRKFDDEDQGLPFRLKAVDFILDLDHTIRVH